MLKILLADDFSQVRDGLKQILLAEFPDVLFGEAENGREAVTLANSGSWDVVILDLAMPGGNGLEALKQIRREHSSLPVLILSNYPEDQYAALVIRAGAAGYLNKESAPEELVFAVRKTLEGGVYISSSLAADLVFRVRNHSADRPDTELSDQEYRVLCFIATGQEIDEIGVKLALGESIIRSCRTDILQKLKMNNNAELAQHAFRTAVV